MGNKTICKAGCRLWLLHIKEGKEHIGQPAYINVDKVAGSIYSLQEPF